MWQRVQRFIQNLIGLSSSEATAFIVLMPLIFLFIFSEPAYRWWRANNEPLDVSRKVIYDSLAKNIENEKVDADKVSRIDISNFMFNPNIATLDELKANGISEKLSSRIIQYRNKGGQFRSKNDVAKIYGMDSSLFKKLYAYIDLPDKPEVKQFDKEKKHITTIQYDLNITDSTSLKSIIGIGSVLASRILKYRESLGGFIAPNQLKEVYGLDSAVIKALNIFFVSDDFHPKRININACTEQELDRHPYFSLREARAVITYRLQHGEYFSITDLQKVKSINETTIRKLTPYISFE